MTNLAAKIKSLPDDPGIYQFFDDEKNLIYVGKSVSLKKRVSSYFATRDLGPKTNLMVKKINDIKYIKVFSEFEALLLEADLIRTHKPFYNIQAKDDKSPLYIRITKGDVPIVDVLRKPEVAKKDFTKGPFPSNKATRDVLRMIRRIFPYCHHKNPKKPCLFVHLGLCPYPYANEEAKEEYLKNIKKIKKLLTKNPKSLIRDLKSEMDAYSKNLMFEQASEVKKQIQKLEYLSTSYRPPLDFLERPTLVDDLLGQRLKDLKNVLGLEKIPKRIECFDISNIGGKQATGSMVVFVNGHPEKGEYRRFKIKFKDTPDDFAMIREVLARRFKNSWPNADLMIIDGGKGQLSSALTIAQKYNKNIKIVSLAKRLEEIFTGESSDAIRLSKESPARQLVQALRDEAHRFAIIYHRLLRSKAFLKN